ncbi:glycerophosphodiester phosphodiesterase 1-like [Saccoglossus kowalevskii]|uniref:Glycerophosphodiester phosphodiesterase 1-like n=1 Tax=Saccoglossus kowalevskii TaxID=10224 RepID=A0ABM0LVN5_SACKO|nr:PREDICTED: glycerophosphodiester phosphodiesterase 1-like [Saccoglossus kowalevskii]
MVLPLPMVLNVHCSVIFNLISVFLVSYVTTQIVLPGRGTRKYIFSAIGTVFVAILVVVGLRIPQLPRSATDPVLEPNRVLVIAHRGGGHDAPENTIAAIREAKKNGADGVELDLEFTEDGVPILLHDSTVDRTTNGSGNINSFTFEEVRKLDASHGHRLSSQFANERIPTLEEATEECLKLGLKIFLDVKANPKQTAQTLSDLYNKYKILYQTSMVISFFPETIYRLRLLDSNIVTGLLYRTGALTYATSDPTAEYREFETWQSAAPPILDVLLYWSHHSWLWYLCGNSAFLLFDKEVSEQVKVYWEARNIELIGWTVNDSTEKRHFEKNLHISYITDSLASK